MPNLLSPGSQMLQPQDILTPFGLYGCMGKTYAMASSVFPLANRIYYYPFRPPEKWLISNVRALNGTVVSGNVDMGIYTPSGNRLGSTGTVAQTPINAPQSIALTAAVQLFPEQWYYFALTLSNVTGTFFRATFTLALFAKAMGVLTEDAGSFGLPATATFASAADSYFAQCGVDVNGLAI